MSATAIPSSLCQWKLIKHAWAYLLQHYSSFSSGGAEDCEEGVEDSEVKGETGCQGTSLRMALCGTGLTVFNNSQDVGSIG